MNLLGTAFGIHEQALQVKSERMELLAKNIANADTPHFKAKDIDFKAVLSIAKQQETMMSSTQQAHFDRGDPLLAKGELFRVPFSTSFDGNTVEIGVEQAHYGKAAADFQASLSFIENRVSSLRKALKGE